MKHKYDKKWPQRRKESPTSPLGSFAVFPHRTVSPTNIPTNHCLDQDGVHPCCRCSLWYHPQCTCKAIQAIGSAIISTDNNTILIIIIIIMMMIKTITTIIMITTTMKMTTMIIKETETEENKQKNKQTHNNTTITTTLKGTIQDFVPAPHYAANCLQKYIQVAIAQSCANHMPHIRCLSHATCCAISIMAISHYVKKIRSRGKIWEAKAKRKKKRKKTIITSQTSGQPQK